MANCCDQSASCLGRKYVVLCLICGIVSSLVGSLIVIIYALIRSNTSSLQYLETIPTYIPAVLLIANGLVVICFAKSNLRNAFLMKTIGGLYLVCALLSVIITVTTTVLHMNRLQTYTECVFSADMRSCTCVTPIITSGEMNVGHHLRFEAVPNCDVVHGLLLGCLRGLFGLSVFAILICIFSLMLVYQLLSHQKKKKYLQQLELRRRYQFQNRGFGCHSSNPYFSSLIFAQNRNHSLRHLPYSCDESAPNGWCLPPHSYEYLDSRSYNRNLEEDIQSNVGIMTNRSNSWTNWFNWPRSQIWTSNNQMSNQSTNRGFLDLFRRNHNNNRESNENNANHNRWRRPMAPTFLPPHVFIPRIGSDGLSPMASHVNRHRDNHLRPTLMRTSSAHRRTRSNDGIFQHMSGHNMAVNLPFNGGVVNSSANMFAIWGPPPPYTCSQPQSLNRINTICNNISHCSVGQHCRQSSGQSSEATPTSKMSTPLEERRVRCNAFSSQGIRLTIEANNQYLSRESKSSCIVEIHVPYSEDHRNNDRKSLKETRNCAKKSKLSFNTMPSLKRSDHLQPINPFMSLSNIPITFPNGLSLVKNNSNLTDSQLESNESKLETIGNVYDWQVLDRKSLTSSSTPISATNTTSEMNSDLSAFSNTDESFSATSFPVDPPTDYKSTLVIQTPNTQSSPLTEQSSNNVAQRHVINGIKEKDMPLNSAQSMPNLSCIIAISSSLSTSTRTQPNLWELHRIASSGNTSTSQDLADFELDLDEESIKMVADLPNDNLNHKSTCDSLDSEKSSSVQGSASASLTAQLIKPPTPFNGNNYSQPNTSSTATLSSLSDPKPELIINVKGIQV